MVLHRVLLSRTMLKRPMLKRPLLNSRTRLYCRAWLMALIASVGLMSCGFHLKGFQETASLSGQNISVQSGAALINIKQRLQQRLKQQGRRRFTRWQTIRLSSLPIQRALLILQNLKMLTLACRTASHFQ